MSASKLYENTNGMPMSNGRNLHMQAAHGEGKKLKLSIISNLFTPLLVSNRLITVGAFARAEIIADMFDKDQPQTRVSSSRGFLTITGHYKGVRVTVVGIGMVCFCINYLI